jgi:hypothetical protein
MRPSAVHNGLIAIHVGEELARRVPQGRRYLRSQLQGECHAPLRHESGVHHEIVPLGMGERACHEPLDECIAIGGGQHFIERVGLAAPLRAKGKCQQVQVVIAQHHDGVITQGADQPQTVQGFGSPIDQVTHEPQLVTVRRKLQAREQRAQFFITALHVPDGIASHCRMPGIARRKGSIGASKWAPSSASIW